MNLGDRMKHFYEDRYRLYLTRRIPAIARLDGKAFHTLTRGCEKPFDLKISDTMGQTALSLLEDVQGAKCAYVQSDEISIMLTDFDSTETDAYFDYNVQKLCSIMASAASVRFTQLYGRTGLFDCRVFNVPKEDVCNYFVWRQNDWFKNSLQLLARNYYSHKELYKKNAAAIHELLYKKGVNWANLSDRWKNGIFLFRNNEGIISEKFSTIFTNDRNSIERYLFIKESNKAGYKKGE